MKPMISVTPMVPSGDDEWKEAIRAAVFCLALDAAYQYGLMTGPAIDVARCEAILAIARSKGYEIPSVDAVVAGGGATAG